MTESDYPDTQKKDFFQECENLTEVLLIKAYARFLRARRLFKSLKNRVIS